jgi:hypothetical protein
MELVIQYIVGDAYMLRHNYCPRWLHVLMPKEAVQGSDGSLQTRPQEWSGISGSIKANIDTQMSLLRLQMREELEKMQENVVHEIQDKMRVLMNNMQDALSRQPHSHLLGAPRAAPLL